MRKILSITRNTLAAMSLVTVASACGSDAAGSDDASFSVVVTTSIHGDIVASALAGAMPDAVSVEVIMPAGADPHDFAASARQAETMENADLLVVNGLDLEEGMVGIIESVADSGTPVFEFADHVATIDGGEDHGDEDHAEGEDHNDEDHNDEDHGDEDHGDEDHADENHEDEVHGDENHGDEDDGDDDHGDEDHGDDDQSKEDRRDDDHDAHDHAAGDPHLWMDPAGLVSVVEALRDELVERGVNPSAIDEPVFAYIAGLEALDATIEATLLPLADDQRVLVTNHDSFGYFAARYGFEVVGTVIPSLTTSAEVSPAALDDLADVMRERSVRAVFAENTESDRLAEALAAEVGGDVRVVELYSGSLGAEGSGAETYLSMMVANAQLIVEALGA